MGKDLVSIMVVQRSNRCLAIYYGSVSGKSSQGFDHNAFECLSKPTKPDERHTHLAYFRHELPLAY